MRCFFVIFAGLLALAAGCAGPAVSSTDQAFLRDADLVHGKLSSAVIEASMPRVQRYLEQLAARITATARELDQQGVIRSLDPAGGSNAWMFGKEMQFHLVDHPRISGFAPGGKHIYVYNGLFSRCRDEDELAAMLCHQYAHVYTRLPQQSIRRMPGETGETALLFPFATMRHPGPTERIIDDISFKMFTRAGWDPLKFASFEARFSEPGGDVDRALMKDRADDARKMTELLPDAARDWARPPIADVPRFLQIQAEVKAAAGSRAPVRQAQLLLSAFPSCLNLAVTQAQETARAELFPPAPAGGTGNKWGKGPPGG